MFDIALKLVVNRLNKVIPQPCGPLKGTQNKVPLFNKMEGAIKNIRVFLLSEWLVQDVSP
jgi:hypothetical protein